jgi:hypothetical protein
VASTLSSLTAFTRPNSAFLSAIAFMNVALRSGSNAEEKHLLGQMPENRETGGLEHTHVSPSCNIEWNQHTDIVLTAIETA